MSTSAFDTEYETILVTREDRVALVTLNRPRALNALNTQAMEDVTGALALLDADDGIGCVVITGSEKAFAAGADIREMSDKTYSEMTGSDYFAGWEALTRVRKPVIAAVAGFALGGGCELAMMCDIIIAADSAKFGQPEVKLGVIPGIGGSQRLTRAIGKAKAMDLCLTGRMIDAAEAERSALVARVVPAADHMAEVMAAAREIASMSLPALRLIKEAVNRAEELPLSEGVRFERRAFHGLFGSHDQIEGMAAFVEKRAPKFAHR